MKLKRILAGVLAGVMAITSSVVSHAAMTEAPTADFFGSMTYAMSQAWDWSNGDDVKFDAETMTMSYTADCATIGANKANALSGGCGVQFYVGDGTDIDEDQTITADITYEITNASGTLASGTKTISKYWDEGESKFQNTMSVDLVGYGGNMSDFTALGTITVKATISNIKLETESSGTSPEEPTETTDKWVKNTDGTYSLTRGSAESAPALLLNLTDYTDADYADITAIELVIDVQNGDTYTNGGFGTNDAVAGWKQTSWDESGSKSLALDGVAAGSQLNVQVWNARAGAIVTLKDVKITAEVAPTTYTVTVDSAIENGTVEVDKTTAAEDETVTVTAKPADGYELDTITVNGEAITATTFTMPAKDVTVSATFKAIEEEPDEEEKVAEVFDKTAADFVVNTVVKQTKTVVAEDKSETETCRFVMKVKKEDAAASSKSTIVISNGTTTVTKDITKCYTSIVASGNTVSEDGYVYIAYTITDVPTDVVANLSATIELVK